MGLTLYEMLALRPAYEAPDASSLMRKISEEPPPRLSAVAAGIPRDLETIVMKAVAREPAHRYQAAEQLADDLRRFLDDRPIHARRVSSVEHLWRWCRRNPAVAGLTATALMLLILVAVVAGVGYIVTNRALDGELVQRRKADATSDLALEALGDIFEQFAPDRMSVYANIPQDDTARGRIQATVQPVLSKEAASLLERLLVFYDRLAAHGGGDVEFRRKSADANRRVGDIRAALGQFESRPRRPISRRSILSARSRSMMLPMTAWPWKLLGSTTAWGNFRFRPVHRQRVGRSTSRRWKHSVRLRRAWTHRQPLRFEMARTCYLLGQPRRPADRMFGAPPPGGPREFEYGGPHDMIPDAPPLDDLFWAPPPRGPGSPPDPFEREENERYLRRAIDLLERLVEEQPTIPDYQHLLACCYRDLPPARPH